MNVKMNTDQETHFCSMPFGPREEHDQIQQENPGNNSSGIDIVIYFADSSGLHLQVVDGQNVTASELFEMVMEEQHYPEEARELFSLWLVSDLLELQLKPTHVPFKLVCYWEELLEKYCAASEFERLRDEPVIMFRRNVFCSCETEKKILKTELSMLRLLYNEAKKNILSGRYPVPKNVCHELAGIQAVIKQKECSDTQLLTVADFKLELTNYLPSHFCKRSWLIGTKENPEHQLYDSYRREREKYWNASLEAIFGRYIEICRSQPYYGCAFFRGQVEHPGRRFLSSRVDDPVYVAININGVYIIDEDDFVLLIGLPYKFLCWERVEPPNEQNSEHLPFLLLQFPVSAMDQQESRDTCLLQIFSKQTLLMDKLIEACIELRRTGATEIDPDMEKNIIQGHGDIAKQFQRLALKTFDHARQLKKSTIRGQKYEA